MASKTQLFDKCGGYRRLHTFTYATIIHLETISFCKRFIPWREDQLGKTAGQMIGAARSGRQNIIEGSERSSTSKETEIKLTDVARASLAELLGDYEIFLAEKNAVPWSKGDNESKKFSALRLQEFSHSDDQLHDYWKYYQSVKPLFAPWFGHENPVIVANAMIILIQRTMGMLRNQIAGQGIFFLEKGGFKERMYRCRNETRDEESQSMADAPLCPECGRPMRIRVAGKGKNGSGQFWGCSAYPECKGTRKI
jgi:four helix bundle suffix protein